jgi:glutamate/tyrosine decarboxylase-like PLP-dependent enzyme
VKVLDSLLYDVRGMLQNPAFRYSKTVFRDPLQAAFTHALKHLDALDTCAVGPRATLETLRGRLHRPLQTEPMDPSRVVEELARDVEGGLAVTGSGRFFGWVIGGALPAALAADWLTGVWDQNAGIYQTSPAASVIEEVAGGWLKDILGLPAEASFALVTGCQMAHVTCLAAARHKVLEWVRWDVERRGLCGAPPIRILANEQCHGSVQRAVRLLGMGTDNIEYIPAAAEPLHAALRRAEGNPIILMLQAGEVNTGVFDDFATLVPLAHKYGAWVHVDGAFGLWAGASPRYRHLLEGVAGADSWATDGHKWLNVPYDCGYAFVAHPEAHRASTSFSASYLPMGNAGRDELDWTPEFSRRARGFATYAALRQLGRGGVADVVDRCCHAAREIVAGLSAIEGVDVLAVPVINQGLVRFPDPANVDHDRHTDRVIAAIQADGEAYFGGATWRGMRVMRISVSNWRTNGDDVRRVVEAVARCVAAARAESKTLTEQR